MPVNCPYFPNAQIPGSWISVTPTFVATPPATIRPRHPTLANRLPNLPKQTDIATHSRSPFTGPPLWPRKNPNSTPRSSPPPAPRKNKLRNTPPVNRPTSPPKPTPMVGTDLRAVRPTPPAPHHPPRRFRRNRPTKQRRSRFARLCRMRFPHGLAMARSFLSPSTANLAE